MKKQIIIVSVLVIIISIFVSCSANSSSEDISTTAVTDRNGTTHYYEPVTDDNGKVSTTGKNQAAFAEIETQSNGKAVTKKDGTYVTKEHTTVLPIESVTDNTRSTTKPESEKSSSDTTKNIEDADNIVEFEPIVDDDTTTTKQTTTTTTTTTKPTKKETIPTTLPATKVVTDQDAWITKWY